MNRAGKDHAMAVRMVETIPRLPHGNRVGVAGNTKAHGERLIALVRKIAEARGVDISHVTLHAIATEAITRAAVDGAH